jgi:hypothetical protein
LQDVIGVFSSILDNFTKVSIVICSNGKFVPCVKVFKNNPESGIDLTADGSLTFDLKY